MLLTRLKKAVGEMLTLDYCAGFCAGVGIVCLVWRYVGAKVPYLLGGGFFGLLALLGVGACAAASVLSGIARKKRKKDGGK